MNEILDFILARGNYWIIIVLMMTGLYITFASSNFIKRLVGLSVFQTSVFLFYITLSNVRGGTAPILIGDDIGKDKAAAPAGADSSAALPAAEISNALQPGLHATYSNPLPHVLILTAIVVGVATLAVGLAIIVRVREAYGTIEADEVRGIDLEVARAEEADGGATGAAQ